jgi:hypothetical protein
LTHCRSSSRGWRHRHPPTWRAWAVHVWAISASRWRRYVALGAVHTSEELERAMHQALNYRAYGFGALKGILKHLAVVPGQVARAAEPAMTRLAVPDVQVQRRELDYYENVGWRR